MKYLLLLFCLSFSTPLPAQTRPNETVRVPQRGRPVANPKIVDGKLVIKTKQTYVVNTELLELESLVMMDGATIRLRYPKTTMIINLASIGKDCKIIGRGANGKPGANGANGYVAKPGRSRLPAAAAQHGRSGRPGGKGQPAKELDLYVEKIKYKAPLTIMLQGGNGGKGGNGGNGIPKQASCSKVTVGSNGGNGAKGGDGGKGALPRIMFGNGVNHNAIISKAIPGQPGKLGRGGKAGLVLKKMCGLRYAKVKKGKPGRDAIFHISYTPSPGQDAGVETDFPYPPPKPSAMVADMALEIPTDATLGTIEGSLRKALQSCGYEDLRYYKVPDGYAVVTGMERFTEKGVPISKERWSDEASFVSEFSLSGYLKSLFSARKGYFRLIVFMVTSDNLLTKNEPISREEALAWFGSGWSKLPKELATLPFTDEHYVSAMIYEFSIAENSDEPIFSKPSSLSAEAHLRGAALWNRLVLDD